MWHKLPTFPEPLRAVLARLPHYPASAACATLLTLQLGQRINTTTLPELADKKVKLRISDMGITLLFQAGRDGFSACRGSKADLTLTATAQDFLSLALRREDPDTLFFSRRLVMEGDTELGVLLKNTLDALPAWRFTLPGPARLMRALRLQSSARSVEAELRGSRRLAPLAPRKGRIL